MGRASQPPVGRDYRPYQKRSPAGVSLRERGDRSAAHRLPGRSAMTSPFDSSALEVILHRRVGERPEVGLVIDGMDELNASDHNCGPVTPMRRLGTW